MVLDPNDVNTRVIALDRVLVLHSHCRPNSAQDHLLVILADAELMYRWLVAGGEAVRPPVEFVILAGPPYEQGDPAPDVEGAPNSMCVMTDTQKVVLEVKAIDAEGHETALPNDTAWTSSDESVVTVEVDPTNPGRVTCHAGAPGVAMVTIQGGGLQGAEAFTVTAGPAAAFQPVVVGVPEEDPNSPNSNGPAAGGGDTPPAGGGDTPPVETGGDTTPPAGDGGTDTPPAGGDTGSGDTGGDTTPPADVPPFGGDDTPPADGSGDSPADNGGDTGSGDTGSDTPPSEDEPLPPVS